MTIDIHASDFKDLCPMCVYHIELWDTAVISDGEVYLDTGSSVLEFNEHTLSADVRVHIRRLLSLCKNKFPNDRMHGHVFISQPTEPLNGYCAVNIAVAMIVRDDFTGYVQRTQVVADSTVVVYSPVVKSTSTPHNFYQ